MVLETGNTWMCKEFSCEDGEGDHRMSITVNLRYTGKDGSARKFAEEMVSSGTVAAIRNEAENHGASGEIRSSYDCGALFI